MDKMRLIDSLFFDAWNWRSISPATIRAGFRALANEGVNCTRILLDGWIGERQPQAASELMILPRLHDGDKYDLSMCSLEFDERLLIVMREARAANLEVILDLYCQPYAGFDQYMPWNRNSQGVDGIYDPNGKSYRQAWVSHIVGLVNQYPNVVLSIGNELVADVSTMVTFSVETAGMLYGLGWDLRRICHGVGFNDTLVSGGAAWTEQFKSQFDASFCAIYGDRILSQYGPGPEPGGAPSTGHLIWRYWHQAFNAKQYLPQFLAGSAGSAVMWYGSTDGDWTGSDQYDRWEDDKGKIYIKPDQQETAKLAYDLFEAWKVSSVRRGIELFHEGQYATGSGEPLPQGLAAPGLYINNTRAMVKTYIDFFGEPENRGKFPVEEIEPEPDPPQPEPEPVNPGITWQGWLGLILLCAILVTLVIIIF